jgi:hypothetical protein
VTPARKRIVAALRHRVEQLRLQRRRRFRGFRDATNDTGTIMIRGFSRAAIAAGQLSEPDTSILIIGRRKD